MDGAGFDRLIRGMAAGSSRRTILRGLVASLLGLGASRAFAPSVRAQPAPVAGSECDADADCIGVNGLCIGITAITDASECTAFGTALQLALGLPIYGDIGTHSAINCYAILSPVSACENVVSNDSGCQTCMANASATYSANLGQCILPAMKPGTCCAGAGVTAPSADLCCDGAAWDSDGTCKIADGGSCQGGCLSTSICCCPPGDTNACTCRAGDCCSSGTGDNDGSDCITSGGQCLNDTCVFCAPHLGDCRESSDCCDDLICANGACRFPDDTSCSTGAECASGFCESTTAPGASCTVTSGPQVACQCAQPPTTNPPDDGCSGDGDCATGEICCEGSCVAIECCIADEAETGRCPEGTACFEGYCDPICAADDDCDADTCCCPDGTCAAECCESICTSDKACTKGTCCCKDGTCSETCCAGPALPETGTGPGASLGGLIAGTAAVAGAAAVLGRATRRTREV